MDFAVAIIKLSRYRVYSEDDIKIGINMWTTNKLLLVIMAILVHDLQLLPVHQSFLRKWSTKGSSRRIIHPCLKHWVTYSIDPNELFWTTNKKSFNLELSNQFR